MSKTAGALYLHVPFCARRCAYCDFSTAATRRDDPLMADYGASLSAMVEQAREAGLLEGLKTAYIGGGTPSLLGPATLVSLVRAAAGEKGLSELTFEANPESCSDAVLSAARDAGATRVSLGVQSLDDGELRALGRIHDAATAVNAIERAAAAGFHVSADLMGAVPLQTPESLARSARGVLDAGAGHVSVYPLQVEEGTLFERLVDKGELDQPSDEDEARAMEAAERVLVSAGLHRYEVASYALDGRECAHNKAYWTAVPYLGLGTSAASMLDREGYEVLRTLAPCLPSAPEDIARVRLTVASGARDVAAAQGSLASLAWEVEGLTAAQAVAEDLMLAARMRTGVPDALVARASALVGEKTLATLHALEGRGLLEHRDGAWRPTEQGWLLGNEVYGELWGLAPSWETWLASARPDNPTSGV